MTLWPSDLSCQVMNPVYGSVYRLIIVSPLLSTYGPESLSSLMTPPASTVLRGVQNIEMLPTGSIKTLKGSLRTWLSCAIM